MTTCSNCGAEIPSGEEVKLIGRGGYTTTFIVCRNCESKWQDELDEETRDPNIAGAVLFGLGASIISIFVWSLLTLLTNYQLGIIAVGVGWIIARAVVLGAGNKRGKILQVMSIGLTLITMAISQDLVRHYYVDLVVSAQGINGIPLLLPLPDMFSIVVDSLAEDPVTVLFWAIAIFEAFKIPARRRLHKAKI
jgi:hypothetical protein